jgi:hypothetical protein
MARESFPLPIQKGLTLTPLLRFVIKNPVKVKMFSKATEYIVY